MDIEIIHHEQNPIDDTLAMKETNLSLLDIVVGT